MIHSSKESRKKFKKFKFDYLGENLACKASSTYTLENMLPLAIAKEGLKMWFDEKEDYDYASNSCTPGK